MFHFNYEVQARDIIALFAFFVSCFTLYVVIKSANRLLFNESLKAQMKLVGELIEDIRNNPVKLHFHQKDFGTTVEELVNFTIFQYTKVDDLENGKLFIPLSLFDNELKEVRKYVSNPLTPRIISNAITGRLLGVSKLITVDITHEEFYLLANNPNVIGLVPGTEVVTTYSGLNSWIAYCITIQMAILKWYEKNGLKEFNKHSLILPNLEDKNPLLDKSPLKILVQGWKAYLFKMKIIFRRKKKK